MREDEAIRHACRAGDLGRLQALDAGVDAAGESGLAARWFRQAGLVGACAHGHLAVAQWMTAKFSLTAADARSRGGEALIRACARGHLAVVTWLTERFSPLLEEGPYWAEAARMALAGACEHGHLAVAQRLTAALDLGAVVDVHGYNLSLRGACAGGHLATAQWLASAFGLDTRTTYNSALVAACAGGHQAVAEWLAAAFGPVGGDSAALGAALRAACVGGHLATARWLAADARTDFADVVRDAWWFTNQQLAAPPTPALRLAACGAVVSNDPGTLTAVCRAGHLPVVQWLAAKTGLARPPGGPMIFMMLRDACVNGHLAVARWLADEFRLGPEALQSRRLCTLRGACAGGHLAVARWLFSACGLAAADLAAADAELFKGAVVRENGFLAGPCRNGHLAVVEWLVGEVRVTPEHARLENSLPLYWACARGHVGVVRLLARAFNFTAADFACDHAALAAVCLHGAAAVRAVVEALAVTRADLEPTHVARMLCVACSVRDLATVQYVVRAFSPSADEVGVMSAACYLDNGVHEEEISTPVLAYADAAAPEIAQWLRAKYAL